jgi:hypothetical protein
MTNKKYFVEANNSSTSVGDTNSFAQIATYTPVIKNKKLSVYKLVMLKTCSVQLLANY